MIAGSYEGKFIEADSISGIWHQGGGQIALNFSRSTGNNEMQKETVLLPNEKEISITSADGVNFMERYYQKTINKK